MVRKLTIKKIKYNGRLEHRKLLLINVRAQVFLSKKKKKNIFEHPTNKLIYYFPDKLTDFSDRVQF